MEEKDKKSLEKVQKLAEAVKNGDEQACQDCLDFYDLSPEQRKEALAYVKGKKKESKADAPTEDAKAKDGEIPPPPPPPPEEKPAEEEKKEAEPPPPPPPPPPAEEKHAEEPPPAEETPAADCKKKATKDAAEGVTEPSVTVPKQNLEGAVTPKKECETKDCGTKDEKKDTCEGKECEDKPATKDEKCDCKDEKCDCKDKSGDGKCDKCGKPLTEDKSCKDEKKEEKVPVEETEKVEEVVVGDAKDKLPPPEQDIPSKMPKEEGEQDIKAGETVAQDQYKAFAAEYSKAQDLAGKVRPLIKETFDSALMREVDVARFAAKHIPALSFAADAADAEVLAAVKGLIAHIAMDESKKETKVFGMDEALPVKEEKPVQKDAKVRDTARALTSFLNA